MCYVNHILWTKCGHAHTARELCAEARRRTPPTYCASVHEPVATNVSADQGVCPDVTRHPLLVKRTYLRSCLLVSTFPLGVSNGKIGLDDRLGLHPCVHLWIVDWLTN